MFHSNSIKSTHNGRQQPGGICLEDRWYSFFHLLNGKLPALDHLAYLASAAGLLCCVFISRNDTDNCKRRVHLLLLGRRACVL